MPDEATIHERHDRSIQAAYLSADLEAFVAVADGHSLIWLMRRLRRRKRTAERRRDRAVAALKAEGGAHPDVHCVAWLPFRPGAGIVTYHKEADHSTEEADRA